MAGEIPTGQRMNFFTKRTIIHWSNLPREDLESPALGSFKIQLDRVWASFSRPGFYQERVDQMILEVFPNPGFYVSY